VPEAGKEFIKRLAGLHFKDKMDNYKYSIGASMRPFIKAGDLVYYKKPSLADIKTGDIILYKDKQGKLILHRVIYAAVKQGDCFLLAKGDAVDAVDALKITEKELIGKVFKVERKQRIINLEKFPHCLINQSLAFLSRFKLNPARIKRLYLDKILNILFAKISFLNFAKAKIDYIFYPPKQIRAVLGNTVLGVIEVENNIKDEEGYRISRFRVKYLGQVLGVKKGLLEHAKRFVREKRAAFGAGGCI
jgi:signal peptidase I